MEPWLAFITQAGFSVGIAVFLVKWMTDRYAGLDKFVREEMVEMIKHNNICMEQMAKAMQHLSQILEAKPCLYEVERAKHHSGGVGA